MRQIYKHSAPKWLEEYKSNFKKSNNKIAQYKDLDNEQRISLREYLVDEQGYICCYCMRRIYAKTSFIEHFRPRSKYPEEELEYNNLYASCRGQQNEAVTLLWHCDQKKENWFDEGMPYPSSMEFEKICKYNIDGTVEPYHPRNHAKHIIEKNMILHLGLNAPFLIRNRRRAIEQSEIMDDAEYSKEDWVSFIQYYDNRHKNRYEEFCGMFIDIMFSIIKN